MLTACSVQAAPQWLVCYLVLLGGRQYSWGRWGGIHAEMRNMAPRPRTEEGQESWIFKTKQNKKGHFSLTDFPGGDTDWLPLLMCQHFENRLDELLAFKVWFLEPIGACCRPLQI